jgi:hypothetical protein
MTGLFGRRPEAEIQHGNLRAPDLYRRAHNALLAEISAVIPVDAVP